MGDDWIADEPAKATETDSQKIVVKKNATKPAIESDKRELTFSDKEIEEWLNKKETLASSKCVALVGKDGTGKSGIALDCRSPEDIKAGMKVIVLDLDGGCLPIKVKYHNNDPNIIIKDPTEYKTDITGTEIDYEKTMEKMRATLVHLYKNKEKYKNVKAIVLDGVDKLLKIAEYQMRLEEHLDVNAGVQYRYWVKRNTDYYKIMDMVKKLPWDRYYITHTKESETGETIPNWQKSTPDMVFQIIECSKKETEEKVELIAHVKKFKGRTELEGHKTVFCEVDKTNKKVNWKGIKEVL